MKLGLSLKEDVIARHFRDEMKGNVLRPECDELAGSGSDASMSSEYMNIYFIYHHGIHSLRPGLWNYQHPLLMAILERTKSWEC
jgi:hypothetical protein